MMPVGILSWLFGTRSPALLMYTITDAVHQIKLGIYWRLSKKYEQANAGKDGYTLAYAIVYELFLDEDGKKSLGEFVPNHLEQIACATREALKDDCIYQAVSIAFAGQIMALAATTGEATAQTNRLIEHATDYGIEIANIARQWGYGMKSINQLMIYATEFRRANK